MPAIQLGSRDFMRAINRSVVLNIIKTHGPIARAEVARQCGLSPATVTGITAELIEDELIFEKEQGDSRGGRRPILLALNPSGGFVVGIKLTESQAIGALTDLEATVIEKKIDPLHEHSPEAVVDCLARLVDELLAQASVSRAKLLGIGVGVAGIVDFRRGLVRQSPFLGWKELPLAELLKSRVNVPVYVDNDVNTLTLAEKLFGAGQGVENFLTVTVGRGIGLGIVVNGQFYRGACGGAGEFGHTVREPEGLECQCGKRGCLEAYASERGLLDAAARAFTAGELDRRLENVDALLSLAEAGGHVAQQIFATAGEILGQEVANLNNIFNPEVIIIGGEGVRFGKWLFKPLQEAVKEHTMSGLVDDTQIRVEPWGDDAWARGSASLVLQELFASPFHNRLAETHVD